MISGNQHVLVEVDSIYKDSIETSIKDSDGQQVEIYLDPSFNPYHHVKTSAEVVAVPERYESETITYKHPNFPRNREEKQVFYTSRDFDKPDIRQGDKAYFHYLSLRPDTEEQASLSYVCNKGSTQIHKVNNKELQCVVRDGEIIMLFGTVLVSATYDSDIQEIEVDGALVKCKISSSGIVTSIGENPRLQEGILAHINPSNFTMSRRGLKKGDSVVYLKNATFENEIEGETYYTMKEWDIIAKKDGDKYLPLGDFLVLKEIEGGDNNIVISINEEKPMIRKGEVLNVGPDVEDISEGDTVMYNSRSTFHIPFDGNIFLRHQEVLAIYD